MSDVAATPRRILLVAYFYPPLNSIGSRRPAALARWLRRRGHDVTVLTSLQSGIAADDAALGVVRTRDLLATRLNWRGDSLKAATGGSDAAWDPDRHLWGSIVIPDIQLVSWAPFAAVAARRLHAKRSFDVVITTSPVESVHAVGLALRREGVPWIADMRDGWRFEAPREDWPLAWQRRVDGQLERLALARADEVVMVTEPLSADLRRRLGCRVETITNGFDPEDPDARVNMDAPVDERKLTLAHTGGLGRVQSLDPLLEALARIARDDPSLPERVELVLAGQRTAEQQALHARPEYAPFIRHVGFVSRPEALAIQRAADVLVLVTSGARVGEATGKLFEYLAVRRPILLFGTGNAAAEIVTGTSAGIAIPVNDPDTAEAALRRILAEGLPEPPPDAAAPYAYPALVERYEQVIERAIAARSGDQRRPGGRTRSADSAPAVAT